MSKSLGQRLVNELYANIREEVGFIKEKAGDTVAVAVENINDQNIEHEDLFNVKTECAMISLQLELLTKLEIPNEVRDIEVEKEFREWAFVIEEC